MVKVLHIIEAFAGGVLGALQTLANGLDDEFEQYILYTERAESPKEAKNLFKPGISFIRSEHLTREISPKEDLAAIREVRRVFDEIQPDVVHLHSTKAGAIGRLALDGKNTPVFYSPQGYSFLMYQCSAAKRRMYYVLEKLLGSRPSVTVASCAGEYDSAKRVSRQATYINNGVNLAELDRFGLDWDLRPEEIKVCTLGRVVPQKDPAMFNRIAEAFPEVKFTWIGGGELEGELTSPNIEITGWVAKEEAVRQMMDSSVFMLTSLYEGLAFSIMEAMYFKRLCIVSRIPGNVDAISDGKTGYICGTFEEYQKVIQNLLDNGIDSRMTDAAHERVAAELNQVVMAREYGALYKKSLKERHGGVRSLTELPGCVWAGPCEEMAAA